MKTQLYQGDCLELMEQIPDGSVDMVLCDLPYGTTRCKWDSVIPFDRLWKQYNRIVKPTGAICLFGAEPFASTLRLSNPRSYRYDWVWDKVKGTGFLNAKKQPMRCHEVVSVFYRKQCTYNPQMTHGHVRKTSLRRAEQYHTEVYNPADKETHYDSTDRYPRSIQVFSTDTQRSHLHPTQKPVALCEYLIRTYTNPGETVLDNCMGSGTTGVACVHTGRNFIGMELDENYYRIAEDRINAEKETTTQ